jgi:plastocyanin
MERLLAATRPSLIRRLFALAVCIAAPAALASPAGAATLEGVVKDGAGKPVQDAVVYAIAPSGVRPATTRAGRAIIDQQDKEFVPHVKPVQTGTPVWFPNKDDIRHHVYSFSPAKKFELPLYTGTPAAPVLFDKPGVVVFGCNIHDWMLGYVFVLETPWFAVTGADGAVQLKDLPPGAYEVRVWHPRMPETGAPPSRRVTLAAGKTEPVEFRIALKPEWRPRRAPTGAGDRYR